MLERLKLAKRITDWYFVFDPYNGCPFDEAWKGTVLQLVEDPRQVSAMISDCMKELDDPDRYSWLIREGNALLQILA